MKKLIVAALVLFMGTTAFSQNVDFGVKFGANFSSFRDGIRVDNKLGFHGGIFGGVKFSRKAGIQADVLYSQQGAKTKGGGEIDLNYVNIPVVLKYYLFDGLNIQVGPQFGILVGDKVVDIYEQGVKIEAKKNDVSGILGAGYDFPFGIRVDARYNFGFTEVFKGSDSKNNIYSIALGYSFL